MQTINIVALGRLKEDYLKSACKEYEKRMGGMARLIINEIDPVQLPQNPSDAMIERALWDEAQLIAKKLIPGGLNIAMCIEGKQYSSEELALCIDNAGIQGKSAVNFIIGSSYGLSDSIKKQADIRMSMSKMTFPHQLARVMLLEQIYRAFSINAGKKYHK